MNDTDALVSLADFAEMARVSRPAVSNWRRRYPDFPSPVAETGATSLFRLGDLMAWMAEHGKQLDVRSVDQLVWSALNPARGTVLPEEAAQAGMIHHRVRGEIARIRVESVARKVIGVANARGRTACATAGPRPPNRKSILSSSRKH